MKNTLMTNWKDGRVKRAKECLREDPLCKECRAILAADRVVRAARRYNNACGTVPGCHTPDPEALPKAHTELCRAVEAMERETK